MLKRVREIIKNNDICILYLESETPLTEAVELHQTFIRPRGEDIRHLYNCMNVVPAGNFDADMLIILADTPEDTNLEPHKLTIRRKLEAWGIETDF